MKRRTFITLLGGTATCADQKDRDWNTNDMPNLIDAWESRDKDICDYATP